MIIYLKKKENILDVDGFYFKCSIGKNGKKSKKSEGDLCTPKGVFKLNYLLYREDRVNIPKTKIQTKKITKSMIWCDDPRSNSYNKLKYNIDKFTYEKIYRKDHSYDYLIVIDFNQKKIIKKRGSAIFIHLTKNYKPTAGCIALKKSDFEILLKIIMKKTFIKII